MATDAYRCRLPVFAGHPFQAEYTEDLRQTIREVYREAWEQEPAEAGTPFIWDPEFAHRPPRAELRTILGKVRGLTQRAAPDDGSGLLQSSPIARDAQTEEHPRPSSDRGHEGDRPCQTTAASIGESKCLGRAQVYRGNRHSKPPSSGGAFL